ncbi:Uncharacterised protein [Cedecea neteri]|uniref:Uncharacterized protein n=1 Tax=Cedecea neteri TaxID=158822 RepID=A0A2X2T3A5_9ENTR|nr:Uncharacterised protein [Cedecea neteri]
MDQIRKMSLFSRIPVTLTLEVASVEISLADLMSVTTTPWLSWTNSPVSRWI